MATMFERLMTGLDEVEGYLAGAREGYKVHVPDQVDVKGIRKRLKMTQAGFSDTFGFSLNAVKHWEGGRRTPEAAARAFLTVISHNPRVVIEALQPTRPATRSVPRPRKNATTAMKPGVALRTTRQRSNA